MEAKIILIDKRKNQLTFYFKGVNTCKDVILTLKEAFLGMPLGTPMNEAFGYLQDLYGEVIQLHSYNYDMSPEYFFEVHTHNITISKY
jgi:hypothetical protein